MPLVALVIIPIAGSAVAALFPPHARTRAAALAGLSTVTTLAALVPWFPRVREGAPVIERIEWVPAPRLDLDLRLDGLSWLFSVVVLGIGASSSSTPGTTLSLRSRPALLRVPPRVHRRDARSRSLR